MFDSLSTVLVSVLSIKRKQSLSVSTCMKTDRQKLIKKLDEAIKTYAKVRDHYTCQKCGKQVKGSGMHGSHVIPVSAGNRLRWDGLNLKALCYHCHINWWHKNPMESAEWFKTKFPDRWEYLQTEKAKGIVKFTTEDLEFMLNDIHHRTDMLDNDY